MTEQAPKVTDSASTEDIDVNSSSQKTPQTTEYDSLSGYALFLDKLKDPSAEQLVNRVKLFVSRFPLTFKRDLAAERLHRYVF